MPFAEHFMISGVTTAAQSATLPATINIDCGFVPTKVAITNETQFGQTGTTNLNIQKMLWDSVYPTQTKIEYINAAGTAILPGVVTTNAISAYDGQLASPNNVLLGPAITGTTITKANPAVCTAAAHGLQTGDVVQISNNVVMKQLGGLYFTITVTGANTFTIPLNTNTANFTAETGFVVKKVNYNNFYPNRLTIAAVTAANPMVISTTTAHGLTVGQQVRVIVPSVFGMTQANTLTGVITVVNSTTSFTIGSINSSAFTAFAWPAVASVPFTPAQIIPIGSGPSPVTFGNVTYNVDVLDDAIINQRFQGFTIGTGLLIASTGAVIGVTASDVFSWTAWRGDV